MLACLYKYVFSFDEIIEQTNLILDQHNQD